MGSRHVDADAVMVRKLNQIFYDVEAEQYDDRHPEVLEGDAEWWRSRGRTVVGELRSGLTPGSGLQILDLGCGTGFVTTALGEYLSGADLIVGLDQSEGMLLRARGKLSGRALGRCRLVRADAADLPFLPHSFDVVAVNSFLHHVYDPRAVLRALDRVLRPGGYVLLAHEPNRAFFQSRLVCWLASLWKAAGFGMKVPAEFCARIDARVREAGLAVAGVTPEEILRLVEYHSPVEQRPFGIDRSKGFSLGSFLAGELHGYALVEAGEYTTFYHRPQLPGRAWRTGAARLVAWALNGKGNLFRAILRKRAS